MSAQFSTLIPDTQQFFAELAQDNTKDWFHTHKPRYETRLKAPALALLEAVAPRVAELAGSDVKPKLYRAHRDVRFSKDKSPYKLHLHMLWAPQGSGTQPAYFFGIAPGYVSAGAGIMGFDTQQIADWRAFVSEREGTALQAKIEDACAQGARIDPPELKRVPSPFDKDHANADLLRRKSLTLWCDLGRTDHLERDLTAAFPRWTTCARFCRSAA